MISNFHVLPAAMNPPALVPTLFQCGHGPEGGGLFNQRMGSESVGLRQRGKKRPRPTDSHRPGMHKGSISTQGRGSRASESVICSLLEKTSSGFAGQHPSDISELTLWNMVYFVLNTFHLLSHVILL